MQLMAKNPVFQRFEGYLCEALAIDVEAPPHFITQVGKNLLQLLECGPFAGHLTEAGGHRERVCQRDTCWQFREIRMPQKRFRRLLAACFGRFCTHAVFLPAASIGICSLKSTLRTVPTRTCEDFGTLLLEIQQHKSHCATATNISLSLSHTHLVQHEQFQLVRYRCHKGV
jgi:hypothetical protein